MPNYHYYQQNGGEEHWKPSPVSDRARLEAEDRPVFISVLAVSRLIDDDLSYEDKLKLTYAGPLYLDWDSKDEQLVIEKVNQFLDKLVEMRVDLGMCRLFASGGKGYHLEIPQKVFMDKVPPKGVNALPAIYREMAFALAVDTLDLKVYSAGKGRMWRTPNVKRPNGRYKVSITADEMREMTPAQCLAITSGPRDLVPVKNPAFCADLAIAFDKAKQKVDELTEKRKRFKPNPEDIKKAQADSIIMAMEGFGLREGLGFHTIAIQLANAAATAGIGAEEFIKRCAGLIENHVGDGDRYRTPKQRSDELARLYRYMDGNEYYEFSIGGIKSLLNHAAPDLDGIPVSRDELEEVVKEATLAPSEEMDEYKDVAAGISISRFGVYKWTPNGNKRICAVSFADSAVLKSSESNQIVAYETTVLVNGHATGRQMLEQDVFSGLVPFNRFVARYGHAFQGSDAEVRTLMMRFVEQAKKKGTVMYISKREGLDLVQIPNHENPLYHQPFLIWSDSNGVITSPEIETSGLLMTYQGYPDPRGMFKTDIAQAPPLTEWVKDPDNKARLTLTLTNLMSCQKPELLGKLIGWYVSCFYKQLFAKVYGKFPLLHVNGAAGVGKTETNILLGSLFNYRQEVRPLSPSSTMFALNQHLTGSSSIPLIVDEYKPQEMSREMHNRMKLLFRDAYNQRPVARGGGTRESDDFRSLQQTELAGPLVFIAEAAEDEAAVMERVVLATFSRPPQSILLKNLAKFQDVRQNHEQLGIMGQYLAARVVRSSTLESFRAEFDALYEVAKETYMLTEHDLTSGELSDDEMKNKQNAKERSVYNHTVARFGFQQWRALVNQVTDGTLDPLMSELEDSIYSRLADLNAATTPEHIKVLDEMAQISHHVHADRPDALNEGEDYAFTKHGRRDCIEIAVVPAYDKYRMHCRSSGTNALFQSRQSFMHALQDSPAFVKSGTGVELSMPNIFTFDIDELAKFSVPAFKHK